MKVVKNNKIVWKYILTLSLIFTILLGLRTYIDVKHHEEMLLEKENALAKNIEDTFLIYKNNLINKYNTLAINYMNNKLVAQYFKNDERELLYADLKKDYEDFKTQDKNLHVMHFMDKNNITILRMHKPSVYHDDLSKKRPIVAYVNKSNKMEDGFEVGKNGIVYRITNPFIYKGEHIGVLEFGIKPDYFIDTLDTLFNIHSKILVKTKELNTLTSKKDYPIIGQYSILSSDPIFEKVSDKIDMQKSQQIIQADNKTYVLLNINLKSYKGEVVSKIFVIKDVTTYVENNTQSLIIVNTLTLMVLIFTLIVIYIILSKLSKEIQEHTLTIVKLDETTKYLQTKANTDQLTNIFNKRYFDLYLKDFLNDTKTGNLLFFDIDYFKKINDTHGHLAGDEILKELANTVKTLLREHDLFVRWGGEEFIVLLENTSIEVASRKANEIREHVQNYIFYNNINVTISIGVVQIELTDTNKSLLARADELLYKAKENGRNRVEVS